MLNNIYKGIIVGAVVMATASCGHDEVYNQMPEYYQESQGLIKTDVDSIHRFRDKFQGYLKKSPTATSDDLYKPTLLNMRDAYREFGVDLMSFGVNFYIIVDYRWEEDTTTYFGSRRMDSYIMSNNKHCIGGQRR